MITTTAQHTPGPWTTRLYDSQIIVYGPGDIQVLATSWHGSIRASYPLKAEAVANATLAAYAPDMIRALEKIAYSATADTAAILRGYAQDAIAAVAKAEKNGQ